MTVCTAGRECLFGEVVEGVVRLNSFGTIVLDEWIRTPAMRSNVELDGFVVMPNHFHAILCIHDVGAHCMRPVSDGPPNPNERQNRAHIGAPLQRRQPDSIGSIIAGFKSAATKRINTVRVNPGAPVWQRNYYERIIRNDRELDTIRQYINDNPTKWEDDENHPGRI